MNQTVPALQNPVSSGVGPIVMDTLVLCVVESLIILSCVPWAVEHSE